MSRRVSLPGADELFRTTGGMALSAVHARGGAAGRRGAGAGPGRARASPVAGRGRRPEAEPAGRRGEAGLRPGAEPRSRRRRRRGRGRRSARRRGRAAASAAGLAAPAQQRRRQRAANRRPSGRERHDEKITVYVSAEELMDLEHARLVLRGEHGLAVDRGRIVREAVAVVLADLESRGDASILVRRLRGR